MKDNSAPAFPVECNWTDDGLQGRQTGNSSGFVMGLTKREWFAGMALVGILSSPVGSSNTAYHNPATAAEWAYQMADAMIAEGSK